MGRTAYFVFAGQGGLVMAIIKDVIDMAELERQVEGNSDKGGILVVMIGDDKEPLYGLFVKKAEDKFCVYLRNRKSQEVIEYGLCKTAEDAKTLITTEVENLASAINDADKEYICTNPECSEYKVKPVSLTEGIKVCPVCGDEVEEVGAEDEDADISYDRLMKIANTAIMELIDLYNYTDDYFEDNLCIQPDELYKILGL